MENLFGVIKKIFEDEYSALMRKVKKVMGPENDVGGGLGKGEEIVEKIATPTTIPVSIPKTPMVPRAQETVQR